MAHAVPVARPPVNPNVRFRQYVWTPRYANDTSETAIQRQKLKQNLFRAIIENNIEYVSHQLDEGLFDPNDNLNSPLFACSFTLDKAYRPFSPTPPQKQCAGERTKKSLSRLIIIFSGPPRPLF